MTESTNYAANAFKSFAYTTIFCAVIAFVTQSIWPSAYLEHLAISLGYGYSSVVSSLVISRLWPQLSNQVVTGLSIVGAMVFGTLNAYWWLNSYEKFSDISQLKPVAILGFIFSATCFFYFYTHEQKLLAQKELETARRIQSEQEKALVKSQLRQLQSQIEPHFLFNTLANVNALISHDPKAAQHMLGKLTDLLRGTLQNSRKETSTLKAELELVDAYLAIQKIRLDERLNYQITSSINEEVLFAPLLLQPLVENAIQHGIEPKVDGGEISIEISQKEQFMVIEVEDSGVGFANAPNSSGNGIGLENTKERIAALYDNQASLKIKQSASGGVLAVIQIPFNQLTS
ncbi:histidine kinase [Vibrio tubiashii]|uniref:sensor histidine kinase n=1 Tax=Vibrio tubiashii TaxID=29498 RepID=UPI00234E87F5|nr:histidine kinase [Vibrio tubiashii]WCP69850.1 histidine kinase [Vibrio tubiashii]